MNKPFKTITEQVDILGAQRHLLFLDKEGAKLALKRYGYYEIINGYKAHFMVDPKDDLQGFKTDTTFEHLFALFTLDREFSEAIMSGLGDFETTLKQALAYAVSEIIGPDLQDYAQPDIYILGEIHKKRNRRGMSVTDRDILLSNFQAVHRSHQQPFAHYVEEFQNIPPWIMVKALSLGTTMYWYRLLPKRVKTRIQSIMLGMDEDILSASDAHLKISQAFGDLLNLSLEYRNLCAHGGRVYNHRNKFKQLSYTPFFYQNPIMPRPVSHHMYTQGVMNSSVGGLLLAISRLDNQSPFRKIHSTIQFSLEQYLQKYPQDRKYLTQALELNSIV